ncbi:MAG: HlyD family secretion protein [Bacteroidales bacterium]|nr:HlyD family secretion protein [Bacteroidales bacterium]
MSYDEAILLLTQMGSPANERKRVEAGLKVQELELSIFEKSLQESARLLEDARILSPQSATLTFINNQIGSLVPQGTQIAIVSDLSCFKAEAEVTDGYANRIHIGAPATIEVASQRLPGTVTNVSPTTTNGVINFVVVPDATDHPELRSGLRLNVFVQYGIEP